MPTSSEGHDHKPPGACQAGAPAARQSGCWLTTRSALLDPLCTPLTPCAGGALRASAPPPPIVRVPPRLALEFGELFGDAQSWGPKTTFASWPHAGLSGLVKHLQDFGFP